MSQENCFDDITNYANTENSLQLDNSLTASYTYDFCKASSELKLFDMSNLEPGETITQLTGTATDAGGNVQQIVATDNVTLDLTGLALDGEVRVDYVISTSTGRTNAAPAVFFDPNDDPDTLGTSDPNRVPLRLKTMAGGVLGCVLCYEVDFIAPVTTWTVVHNTGVLRPASLELYNLSDARMFTGITVIDSNSFSITFSSPKSGRVKALFIKP